MYSNDDAEITHKIKMTELPFGTTIEVRRIHMHNPRGGAMFKKFVKHQYELALMAMT